jgi:hypothetical protein
MTTAARRDAPEKEVCNSDSRDGFTCGMTAARNSRPLTNAGSMSFLSHLSDPARAPSRRPPIVHDPETLRDREGKLLLTADAQRVALHRLTTDTAVAFTTALTAVSHQLAPVSQPALYFRS